VTIISKEETSLKKRLISIIVAAAMIVSLVPTMSVTASASMVYPTNLGSISISSATYNQATGEITVSWNIGDDNFLYDHPRVPFEVYVIKFGSDEFEHLATVEYDGRIGGKGYSYVHKVDKNVDFVVNYYEIRQYVGNYTVNYEGIAHNGSLIRHEQKLTNLIVTSRANDVIWSPEGVRWQDYTRVWKIEADDPMFSIINTNDFLFKVSIVYTGAGIPELDLGARRSPVGGIRNETNRSEPFQLFTWTSDLKVDSIEIRYEIPKEHLDSVDITRFTISGGGSARTQICESGNALYIVRNNVAGAWSVGGVNSLGDYFVREIAAATTTTPTTTTPPPETTPPPPATKKTNTPPKPNPTIHDALEILKQLSKSLKST